MTRGAPPWLVAVADVFAEHLRSEVDLATIRTSLATTASEAVRPASADVWLSAVESR